MPEQAIPAEVTPETALISSPQKAQALIGRANHLITTSEAAPLVTPNDYAGGAALLADLKSAKAALKAEWKYQDEPPLESIKRHKELFSPAHDRLTTAITTFDGRLTSWRHAQEELRKEEERRQNEIIERKRQTELAEAAAVRAKADADAAELRRKAEEAAAAGNAAQAARYEQRATSKVEAAESRAAVSEMTAESLPAARVASAVPKIAGSFGRSKGWGARERASTVDHPTAGRKFTSLEVLILAVADAIALGQPWPETNFLMVNQKALDKRADDLKEDFNIPGFESYWKGESTVSRGR